MPYPSCRWWLTLTGLLTGELLGILWLPTSCGSAASPAEPYGEDGREDNDAGTDRQGGPRGVEEGLTVHLMGECSHMLDEGVGRIGRTHRAVRRPGAEILGTLARLLERGDKTAADGGRHLGGDAHRLLRQLTRDSIRQHRADHSRAQRLTDLAVGIEEA